MNSLKLIALRGLVEQAPALAESTASSALTPDPATVAVLDAMDALL